MGRLRGCTGTMFGTLRKHSQSMWIVIIIVIVISFVIFFTPSVDVQDWFSAGRASGGLTAEEINAQREAMVGDVLSGRLRNGSLPNDDVDFDGANPPEVGRFAFLGAVRLALLKQAETLEIEFSEEAVQAFITKQRLFSNPQSGQFDINIYNTVLGTLRNNNLSVDDLHRYYRNEMVLEHLHQSMGASGGLLSQRALRPLVKEHLVRENTEYHAVVALIQPADFNGSVTGQEVDGNATTVAEWLPTFYTNRYQEPVKTRFVQLRLAFNQGNRQQVIEQVNTLARKLTESNRTVEALRQLAGPALPVTSEDIVPTIIGQHPVYSAVRDSARAFGRAGNYVHPKPFPGRGVVVFAGMEGDIEEQLAAFDTLTAERKAELRKEYVDEESVTLANEAGRSFRENLVEKLKAGQAFEAICGAATNVAVVTLPPISRQSTTNDAKLAVIMDHQLNLQSLVGAAEGLTDADPEKPEERLSSYEGAIGDGPGFILHLIKKVEPTDESLAGKIAVAMRNERLFHEYMATHQAPQFSQSQLPPAKLISILQQLPRERQLEVLQQSRIRNQMDRVWPDWMRRNMERTQLLLYIAAKENRMFSLKPNPSDPAKITEIQVLGNKLAELNATRNNLPAQIDDLIKQMPAEDNQTAQPSSPKVLQIQRQISELHQKMFTLPREFQQTDRELSILKAELQSLPGLIEKARARLAEISQP